MLYAEKGNKVKEIDESMIESCVEQGYKIVNEVGTVIKDSVPTDTASLKLAYRKHEETIKALEAENKALKAKIAELEGGAKADTSLSTAKKRKTATE